MLHKVDTAPEGDEWNLIFDSWARSWMKSRWSGTVRNCDWDDTSRKASKELTDRPTTVVLVAYQPLEDGTRRVKGYIVAEPSKKVIHWVYTKRDFRNQGVARELLQHVMGEAAAPFSNERKEWRFTHCTDACRRLFRNMRHDKSAACSKG